MLDSPPHSDQILSSILLENISGCGGGKMLLEKMVLDAASLHRHRHQQRQVLRLELTLDLMLEPSLELGL
jgi:hypothetical protein